VRDASEVAEENKPPVRGLTPDIPPKSEVLVSIDRHCVIIAWRRLLESNSSFGMNIVLPSLLLLFIGLG
jgi:hypothetical protein